MLAPRQDIDLGQRGLALEAAGWSMRLLREQMPDLLAMCGRLAAPDRAFWLRGLRQAWKERGWSLDAEGRRELLALAAAWRDHPLALALAGELDARGELDAAAALRWIASLHALGEAEAALALAWRWQLLAPRERGFAAAHRRLSDWLAWRQGRARFQEADLRLEPLWHQHIEDFAWQYHDPDIRALCRMPDFQDDAQWHAWLEENERLGDEAGFAILHIDQGFVGCVHLVLAGDMGFLYYWLGRDFRGQGLASRAAALLLERVAPRVCYAKVYQDNAASLRLLRRLGFADTGIRAAPPDATECFLRLGEPASRGRAAAELHELMTRMRSDTRVAAPLTMEEGR